MSLSLNQAELFDGDILAEIRDQLRLLWPEQRASIDRVRFVVPPPHVDADYAFGAFSLADISQGLTPTVIAHKIVEHFTHLSCPGVTRIYSRGPYVNVVLNRPRFIFETTRQILAQGRKYGASADGAPAKVLLTVIFPDTAAQQGLSGLRLELVAQVLKNCHELNGTRVIRSAHYLRVSPTGGAHDVDMHRLYAERTIEWQRGQATPNFIMEHHLKPESEAVIQRALDTAHARKLNGTDVVVTVPCGNEKPLILRKQNGSATRISKLIAHLNAEFQIAEYPHLITLSSADDPECEMTKALRLAQRLGFLLPSTTITKVTVASARQEIGDVLGEVTVAMRFGMLRSPLGNDVNLYGQPGSSLYEAVESTLGRLRSAIMSGEATSHCADAMEIVKFLLEFPRKVCAVLSTNERYCQKLGMTKTSVSFLSV